MAQIVNCAKILEQRGYFGDLEIVKGLFSELGKMRQHPVLKFNFEVRESKASVSIDTITLKVYALVLSEPYRSITELEILAGLPVGACTQNQDCYKNLEGSILGNGNGNGSFE